MTYLSALTTFHTALSLVATLAGAFAVHDLFRVETTPFWTRMFLATAVATSVTGFFFPPSGVTPAQIVGVIALVILALVLLAFYRYSLRGAWRAIYAAGMVASLYLLVFVCIVQVFQKISILRMLAPTGSEPPFVIAQAAALVVFIALGVMAALRFRPVVQDGLA